MWDEPTLVWLALGYNVLISAICITFAGGWIHCALHRRAGLREMRRRAREPPPSCKDPYNMPQVSFVMPVKGTHAHSEASWISQVTRHGYHGQVECIFVVQERADPAYQLLQEMQADGRLPTDGVRVLVAGLTKQTSQKLHNLIYAIERVAEGSEYVLMLDDDMMLHAGAVADLTHELRDASVLAASGFSCDVPGVRSVVCAAACMLRLAMDISVSSGKASTAWGVLRATPPPPTPRLPPPAPRTCPPPPTPAHSRLEAHRDTTSPPRPPPNPPLSVRAAAATHRHPQPLRPPARAAA